MTEPVEDDAEVPWVNVQEVPPSFGHRRGWTALVLVKHFREERVRIGDEGGPAGEKCLASHVQLNDVGQRHFDLSENPGGTSTCF